ncbi:MAG: RagB/SusD family nutrient uptake outer membrane protein [Bacteroidales bacterium]|nr:RagB/SusD family nutrient uptake outer membrane protein [Bacteroidales bacterium]
MKKIFILIVSAAALLLTTGCNDFLDRQPITNITPEKYFKSADELAAYTVAYYETFFPSYRGNYNVGVIWEDACTDNLVRGGSDFSTALQYFSSSNGRFLVPTGQNTSTAFSRIRVCNYFLEQVLPKMQDGTLSGSDVNQYVGEMYVMRAQAYFYALRNFGDFPIIESVLPDDNDVLVEASKRSPRNEVARFIISDLDKAISLLGNGTKQRITKDLALLIKSRMALYEGTFEKYHKGSGRVPGDATWPGASRNAGKSFDIDGEVKWFLGQCVDAAQQVADAHQLVSNSHVMNPTAANPKYGWNPYFEMFNQPDASGIDEVILYREYDRELNVTVGQGPYILEGGNCGPTRSHVDGFLMTNGLPIYAAGSGYKGDETLDLQQEDRDERLQLFVFNNSDLLVHRPTGDEAFSAPALLEQPEHRDVTGFRIRKSYTYDETQTLGASGNIVGTNDMVLYRAAEAYLNYIEAYYELNGNIGGKADAYWKAIRTRAGVDPDYNKTIAATDLSKEDDWGKRSGDKLIDATLFNIRRERRCEFIGEGFRWNDLIRWRSFDHLMTEKWIPEGVNLWEGPLKDDEKYIKTDAAGNLTGESKFVECASGKADANISARTDSKYVRPLRVIFDNNELYDGYTWHKAYYLQPYGLQDLTLTSEDGTAEGSVAYQNPYWPSQASEGALE